MHIHIQDTTDTSPSTPRWASFRTIDIRTSTDRAAFLQLTKCRAAIAKIRLLIIHLDASELASENDFNLAAALTTLHPIHGCRIAHQPHNIEEIRLVIHGDFLFTRYRYEFVSPALFNLCLPQSLQYPTYTTKLLMNRFAPLQKRGLAFCVSSTETALAKALLAIRGVRSVTISGDGRMESGFRETLKRNLTLVPEMVGLIPCSSRYAKFAGMKYATVRMDSEGVFYSEAYEAEAGGNPYAGVRVRLRGRGAEFEGEKGLGLYDLQTMDSASGDLQLGWRIRKLYDEG